ncbi:hypothetical protein PtA15_9A28 [Puccinia triticina]|nr:uncharacterized protein PtA15_9A28 [Puccinia triticina]WAQ87904.1 hypothetical protein PtA15_9A28 [Puccinia triticina]
MELTKRVKTKLGVHEPFRFAFFGMHILEKGATIDSSVNPEKTPGVFATLIICLPSAHTGGEVVVRHDGQSKTLKTSDANQSYACWWYSDVAYDVLPVQSGYRCVLTYKLAIKPGHDQTPPSASLLDSTKKHLRNTFQTWLKDFTSNDDTDVPSHLYHILHHIYTQDTMSLEKLKTVDSTRIDVLRDCARELPFDFFFALLEKKEEGTVRQNRYENRYEHGYNDYDTDSDSCASYHSIDSVDHTRFLVKSLRGLDGTILASNFHFNPRFCSVTDPFRDPKTIDEDFEYEGHGDGYVTHRYRGWAVVIVPHQKIGEYLARGTFGSSDEDDTPGDIYVDDRSEFTEDYDPNESLGNMYFHSALRYLGQIRSGPSARKSMLDAICVLYVSKSSEKLTMIEILKSALEYSHYTLFQTVGVRHQGHLPVEFFDWAKGWLDLLPDAADRTEKYQTWVTLLIQDYPYMTDCINIIRRISNPTFDVAVADGSLSSMDSWAKDTTRRCIQSFPETNRKPTLSDAECIVTALFDLDEPWQDISALLTSIFDRFPRADATAFLLEVLFQLKFQAEARHLPTSDTMKLYRSLSLRLFNRHRRFSDIITAAKARLESQPGPRVFLQSGALFGRKLNKIVQGSSGTGLVVTPQALVKFACDLNHIATDTTSPLKQFVLEITAQCVTFSAEDIKGLWMPFLCQLIQDLASRSVSLNTPHYQQLTHQLIKQADDKVIGLCPQAGVNSLIPRVDCTCKDCEDLNRFLHNGHQRVGHFSIPEARREHLKRQLDQARIAVTQKTIMSGRSCTLAVTKTRTLEDEVNEWKTRQNELYGFLTQQISQEQLQSLLGAQEATRVRSLAKPRQPAIVSCLRK